MPNMNHAEPLVRLEKEQSGFSVSPKVNAKEFHDAFEQMPVSKPVAQSLYKQAGIVLAKAGGTQSEFLVAVDARTGDVIADNLHLPPDRSGRTGFTDRELNQIRQCGCQIITVHNHPSSTRPSIRDLLTAASYPEIIAGVVVGHDGSVWYYSAPDEATKGLIGTILEDAKQAYGSRGDTIALNQLLDYNSGHHTFDWRRLR